MKFDFKQQALRRVAVCKGSTLFSHSVQQKFVAFQELREQVEKLEAELEEYKKGVSPVTALAPFRGRTQSYKGILLIKCSIASLG